MPWGSGICVGCEADPPSLPCPATKSNQRLRQTVLDRENATGEDEDESLRFSVPPEQRQSQKQRQEPRPSLQSIASRAPHVATPNIIPVTQRLKTTPLCALRPGLAIRGQIGAALRPTTVPCGLDMFAPCDAL